ncbi:MAG: ATP-binding protein [Dehalococcoidia bacterium]
MRQRSFTSDASHELRTPLALIRGNAELLSRHPDRPIGRYLDVVEDITSESDRLARLVSNLLTLACSDEGSALLSWRAVDLSDLGTRLLRRFEQPAAAKGLALGDDVRPGVTLWGDPDRLEELIIILMDNAIRYTERGTVTLHIGREDGDAAIRVSDTGPGIAAEHLPRLFDRFYRTDAARSSRHGGVGLGLAIARWIAEAHGGRIRVTSAVGAGSIFTVGLPLEGPAAISGAGVSVSTWLKALARRLTRRQRRDQGEPPAA